MMLAVKSDLSIIPSASVLFVQLVRYIRVGMQESKYYIVNSGRVATVASFLSE